MCTDPNDEDGVLVGGPVSAGGVASFTVSAGSDTACALDAWVDWNRNGAFGDRADEQIAASLTVGASPVAISPTVPGDAAAGVTYARFRCSSTGGLGPTGEAADGEVEDHTLAIVAPIPQIGIAKRLVLVVPVPENLNLFTVTFEVLIENYGGVPLSQVNATALFSAVFVSPLSWQLVDLTSTQFVVNPDFDGDANPDLLAPDNHLGIGELGTVTIVLLVDSTGEEGPFYCSSTATGTPPTGPPVTDVSPNGPDPDPDRNGTPTDNQVPTPVPFPRSVPGIPLLDVRALALLALLIAAAGSRLLSRG